MNIFRIRPLVRGVPCLGLFCAVAVLSGCNCCTGENAAEQGAAPVPTCCGDASAADNCGACCAAKPSACCSAKGAAPAVEADADGASTRTAFLAAEDAKEKEVEVKVGDPAPVFEAVSDQGKPWKSSDHVAKKVLVIYFYPADFTGGCTKQACGFRDDFQALTDKGVEIVGISGDSAKTHALFKKQHKLNFTLLADEDGAIAKKFGVPVRAGGEVKAKIDGEELLLKRTVTASRWTFVIGKDGNVLYKNAKVNAAEDSKEILKLVAKAGK